MSDPDTLFMQRALTLAANGWGSVHPNPMVGAVVVRDGEVAGEGWHARYGEAHAEVRALANAAGRTAGSTLYVTLEPCAHTGKTPPCTEAIARAGVTRVVYGSSDPDPAAGGGAEWLAEHGVEVRGGVAAAVERRLNAAFHHWRETGRPWVALKLAMSLDGRLSREPGRPTRVTGDLAIAEVHRLRAGFDAILVGAATVLADDPELTARGEPAPRIAPIRVVLDPRAGMPADSRLLRGSDGPPVWVVTSPEAPEADRKRIRTAGARLFTVPSTDGGVELGATLGVLGDNNIRSILCEGGGRLAAALIESDSVDRVYLFVAPRFLGSRGAPAFPVTRESGDWEISEVIRFGADVLLILDRDSASD